MLTIGVEGGGDVVCISLVVSFMLSPTISMGAARSGSGVVAAHFPRVRG